MHPPASIAIFRYIFIATVFMIVGLFAYMAWAKAGTMSIMYSNDNDAHVTNYSPRCDPIVKQYLGPYEGGHLTVTAYENMLTALAACEKRGHK